MFCNSCGADNPAGQANCHSCGEPVQAASIQDSVVTGKVAIGGHVIEGSEVHIHEAPKKEKSQMVADMEDWESRKEGLMAQIHAAKKQLRTLFKGLDVDEDEILRTEYRTWGPAPEDYFSEMEWELEHWIAALPKMTELAAQLKTS